MKLLAYGPPLFMSAALTADAIPGMPDFPSQLLNGGSLAVLGWTIWYVLAKVLPAHTAAMAAQRDAFLAAARKDDDKV